jgi:DNA-directed RNA polymerase subunit L
MMPTQLSKKGNTLEVRFVDEDTALADILHHELLKDSNVVFAGVAPIHPLLAETKLTIQGKGDPAKSFAEGVKRAADTVKEMLDKTEAALKKRGS